MNRGDLYWLEPDPVRGSEQAGRRPAIVVSRDSVNAASPVVVVVPLTRFRGQRLYPSDVSIRSPEGGLLVDSVAIGLQIRAVDKNRLGERLGSLSAATMILVERAIVQALDLPAPDDAP